jgi:hypothetical protein
LFEFGKEVLDQMAVFIYIFIVIALGVSVRFGRDNNGFSYLPQWFDHPFIRIIRLVRNQRLRLYLRQKNIGPL